MAIRRVGQLSLADSLVSRQGGAKLAALDLLIDWPAIAALLSGVHASSHGAPAYPPLVMVKALLLQQWYALSDPQLEEALVDRLSFRRFLGLSLGDETPDHSSISRFRSLLAASGLAERVFDGVTRQIDERGLILRKGTMVDATLVEAQIRRPGPPKDEAEERGEAAPADARAPSKLVGSALDADAAWAKKGGKRTFGYKGHVAVISAPA